MNSPVAILLLEDDPNDAGLMEECLQADHFITRITRVQDRTEFLAALEDGEFDLILSDHKLPSFDGLSALNLALGVRPDIPFIFVSGTLGEEAAIEALKVGATDYVLKTRLSRLVPAVQRALGQARDRAARKRAETELRDSEQNYRMLFESIDEGFCTIEVLFDPNEKPVDYRFLQVNPSFERQTGIEDAAGRRMREIAPQHEEHWFEIYGRIALTGESMRFENEARQLGRWYDVYAFRVEDPKRRRVGILFNDITERKRAEAEARDSERRYREVQADLAHASRVATIGQLMASIAHEIRQPIGAAIMNAQAGLNWLNAQPPDLEEVRQALGGIVGAGRQAGEVIDRTRALIKKAPSRKEDVAVNEAVLEVIALTRAEVLKNGVAVRMQLAEGLPHVHGDRVQLQQVLLNLIINAIEAMRDVGEGERELLISTRNEVDGVCVEVRDSGPGFAPAALEHLFDAFYTTKPGGLGLGLSVCRSILEAHNGRLWASPNLPRGAIFRFIAPARSVAAS